MSDSAVNIQHSDPHDTKASSLALYVHIPFCETKCNYCDFNTYAGIESLMPTYIKALRNEVTFWGTWLDNPIVNTVFFGGGTPSYLPEKHLQYLLETIGTSFTIDRNAEITLEANPGDLDDRKLLEYVRLGVNRLSIGVQSFDDRLLKVLSRRHTATDAIKAFNRASKAGFDNISIDLMYGLPSQTLYDWKSTLDTASGLNLSHISMYCLTLEGGTPLERWVNQGIIQDPDPDLAADMYLLAQQMMAKQGFKHYEISNWARPGFESRHNLSYWYNQDSLGVGPGAHSYLQPYRFFNINSPREYISRLLSMPGWRPPLSKPINSKNIKTIPVIQNVETIGHGLEMAETLMMGLRLQKGISLKGFSRRFGIRPDLAYRDAIYDLTELGLLETHEDYLRLTDHGRIMANEVFTRFFM